MPDTPPRSTPRKRRTRPSDAPAKPFIKWVGGKRQLLKTFDAVLPSRLLERRFSGRYVEPFVGGGALFFHLLPTRATLGDANAELIDTYTAIRDELDELLAALKKHRYDKDYYYSVRARNPAHMSQAKRAARMIFLNRTGFNGLYRVNKKGLFNVPFGRHKDPNFCDEQNLRACSELLQNVELKNCDFEALIDGCEAGDFAYMDPPYAPVPTSTHTASFTSYQAGGFGWEQQERLARAIGRAAERGVLVMASNSDIPQLRELYGRLGVDGLRIDSVSASRMINRDGAKRGKVGELLIHNCG